MSGLLNLHHIAAARGDGLHPKLLELLQQRAVIEAPDSSVVELCRLQDGGFIQAGPSPQPAVPDFLPGNVVGFKPAPTAAAVSRKTSSA